MTETNGLLSASLPRVCQEYTPTMLLLQLILKLLVPTIYDSSIHTYSYSNKSEIDLG